jgi:4'-phosphopantetheinyl transferase
VTSLAVVQGIEVIVARLDEHRESLKLSAASLSPAEQERAARFRFSADRRRYIASHATLRALLGARPGLRYSLSRSAELAAYAFARGRHVGIDIEAIRPLAEADAIVERTFPRRERDAYAALPVRDKALGFFRGWTRTEALAKALGGGLTLAPEALDAALEEHWTVRSFVPAAGFAGALACSPAGRCQ